MAMAARARSSRGSPPWSRGRRSPPAAAPRLPCPRGGPGSRGTDAESPRRSRRPRGRPRSWSYAPTRHGRIAPNKRPMQDVGIDRLSSNGRGPCERAARVDFHVERREESDDRENRRADREALADRGRGVADGVELVGDRADVGSERRSSPRCRPPLSAMGPYASTVMTIAVPASMPTAASAMP